MIDFQWKSNCKLKSSTGAQNALEMDLKAELKVRLGSNFLYPLGIADRENLPRRFSDEMFLLSVVLLQNRI